MLVMLVTLLTRICDQSSIPPETHLETLSILSILITRFPTYLADPNLNPDPLPVLVPLLQHTRPAVRKRVIGTVAQYLPLSRPEYFGELLKNIILPNLSPSAGVDKQRTTVQLVAAVARHSPHQVATVLNEVVPGIANAIKKDDEELRDSGLQALEALVLKCPTEITPFLTNIIQAGTQFIKYDPVCFLVDTLQVN
jgi:cullin-associated NEDD8-dissociated protein 1